MRQWILARLVTATVGVSIPAVAQTAATSTPLSYKLLIVTQNQQEIPFSGLLIGEPGSLVTRLSAVVAGQVGAVQELVKACVVTPPTGTKIWYELRVFTGGQPPVEVTGSVNAPPDQQLAKLAEKIAADTKVMPKVTARLTKAHAYRTRIAALAKEPGYTYASFEASRIGVGNTDVWRKVALQRQAICKYDKKAGALSPLSEEVLNKLCPGPDAK